MNKKVISIVAIIALVAILGVCLVACNADSYAKKLEGKGYTVAKMTDEEAEEFVQETGLTSYSRSRNTFNFSPLRIGLLWICCIRPLLC